jgi:hypothetical protein
MPYPKKTWNSDYLKTPFRIVSADDDSDDSYMVENGIIFSTFSFSTKTSIAINNIGTAFNFKPGYKFYIEINVDSNLQPSYAQIKCTEVNTEDNWKYYPFNSLIEPEFTEADRENFQEFPWNSGRILKLPNSRRQTKLYILIGYRLDDLNKNGNEKASEEEEEEENENENENNEGNENEENQSSAPIQILKENIILLGGTVDYAPGLIPVPYFYGGLTHTDSILLDTEI